ncbi:MAG: hypothetical protein H0U22_02535 [Geodermatophilaceae bacterium]|nr:hypothetical protein [Geodermatophilaceae bacterium]
MSSQLNQAGVHQTGQHIERVAVLAEHGSAGGQVTTTGEDPEPGENNLRFG